MAIRLTSDDKTIQWKVSLIEGSLSCYDTIGDRDFDYDRDEILHWRSAYELVRDQLSRDQQAELDTVDGYWRRNAKAFNEDFSTLHAREDFDTALEGFVEDEKGRTPSIPDDHWWWFPIEE